MSEAAELARRHAREMREAAAIPVPGSEELDRALREAAELLELFADLVDQP